MKAMAEIMNSEWSELERLTKKYGELTIPQIWERLERMEVGVARAKELRDDWLLWPEDSVTYGRRKAAEEILKGFE
jgi:hypothetical protein